MGLKPEALSESSEVPLCSLQCHSAKGKFSNRFMNLESWNCPDDLPDWLTQKQLIAESLPIPKSHCQNNALFLYPFSSFSELFLDVKYTCALDQSYPSLCDLGKSLEFFKPQLLYLWNGANDRIHLRLSFGLNRQHVKMYRILHDKSIKLMSVAIVISLWLFTSIFLALCTFLKTSYPRISKLPPKSSWSFILHRDQ